ncbi:flagellar associated protein [Raphidocelis subcapitata]|uniref:Dynein regulatory complex subunit 3 n=1 Tax=Raphidocelis subcapitata TaxID=307507 RepID=A0A2V0P7F0_9CHLO|nr:flagellar associated protein [Raphidocelis subcapitata]|eukprot:GBF93015.1 flagellar associated protein [Raphidocelis subcapitata]
MPVSLERLIAEVVGTDADIGEEKRRQLPFSEVEVLAFSFRNLARITSLKGLESLTKLQLDNNKITRIENIGHLTNLTWLDLSFNRITAIEGLEALTRLRDLSLFHNKISTIGGLDGMADLNVLSIGQNNISKLSAIGYLRRFPRLQLVNLAGNPVAKDPSYRSFVLSHLPHLVYLDYQRVPPGDVAAAKEAHQDELLEIQEREDTAAHEAGAAAERAAHAALMEEANLTGVESLVDDVTASDPEWPKLAAIPGLTEPWGDIRDKWRLASEEFKLVILEAHGRKRAESAEFRAALEAALAERDGEARRQITEYEKARKAVARTVADGAPDAEERVLGAKVRLMALQEALLELDLDSVDAAAQLCQEYDRNNTELAEANKLQFNSFFTQAG